MLQSMEGPPMRSAASAGRAGKLSLMEGVVGEVGKWEAEFEGRGTSISAAIDEGGRR
jgi:hypothetical protein